MGERITEFSEIGSVRGVTADEVDFGGMSDYDLSRVIDSTASEMSFDRNNGTGWAELGTAIGWQGRAAMNGSIPGVVAATAAGARNIVSAHNEVERSAASMSQLQAEAIYELERRQAGGTPIADLDLPARNYDGIIRNDVAVTYTWDGRPAFETVEERIQATRDRCFVAGVEVLVPGGGRAAIETLAPGDFVLAFDPGADDGRGALTPARIVRIYRNVADELIRLRFEDGRADLVTTPGHAFLDETGAFTKIGDLARLSGGNVRLIDETGAVVCARAERIVYGAETAGLFEQASARATVAVGGGGGSASPAAPGWRTYNFEVEGVHTYVAGGIRVHNDSGLFGAIGDRIDNAVFDKLGRIGDSVGDIVSGAFHAVGEVVSGIAGAVTAVANGIGGAVNAISNGIRDAGNELRDGDLIGAIGSVARGVGEAVVSVVGGVADAIGSVVSGIGNAIAEIGRGIGNAINSITGRSNDNDNDGGGRDSKPVILDLDGDGVEIEVNGGVSFDVDNDGFKEQTAWAGPDDGFLVIDLDADGTRGSGDGKIDQTKELILTEWVGWDNATDLQALSTFDAWASRGGNDDGRLDHRDGVWSELRIWRDGDGDGEVDGGELKTLAQMGVTRLNLTYDDGTDYGDTSNDVTVYGNTVLGEASYWRNGEKITGGLADVALAYEDAGWRIVEENGETRVEFEDGTERVIHRIGGSGNANFNVVNAGTDGARGNDGKNKITAESYFKDVTLTGRGGADTLIGGDGNDVVIGDAGADSLKGGSGNDQIFFDAADVAVLGGSGVDVAVATGSAGVTLNLASSAVETAYGTETRDTMTAAGAGGGVSIYGEGGNDRIYGGEAGDVLSGDDGNDRIEGESGDDRVIGGRGADTLRGDGGDDRLVGDEGADRLEGGKGADLLYGGDGDDQTYGHDGDDSVRGGEGNDDVQGNSGDDLLVGDAGVDTIRGGDGDDYVDGGDDWDRIYTGSGDDTVLGGAGGDQIHIESSGDKRVESGVGNDKVYVAANASGAQEVLGGAGWDTLYLTGRRSDYAVAAVNWSSGTNEKTVTADDGSLFLHIMDFEKIVYAGSDTHWLPGRDHTEDNSAAFIGLGGAPAPGSLANANTTTGAATARFGAGDDSVAGSNGANRFEGQSGADTLALRGGADTGIGGAGADAIFGEGGNDTLNGGSGADTLSGGDGDDSVLGGYGADVIGGDAGADTLKGEAGADAVSGGSGADRIYGGDGGDQLTGGADGDRIYGGDGGDGIAGDGGADSLRGGDGGDDISGGDGNDTMNGDDGDDVLAGGRGRDSMIGGYGDDRFDGGADQDTINGGAGSDFLLGGASADSLIGGNGDDQLQGGDGADRLYGGNENDLLEGGAGGDLLNGGGGVRDIASYANSNAAVNVKLFNGSASGGHAAGDSLSGIEGLIGSRFNDKLNGSARTDHLSGGAGNDSVYGLGGDDIIYLEGGADVATGGTGDDDIKAGAGNDNVYGNEGDDNISGGAGNDRLFGQDGADLIFGNTGDDLIRGGFHNDTLEGGMGDDTIYSDTGADHIAGGAGDDLLDGGASGNARDVFIFREGDGDDTVLNYQDGYDKLRIDIEGVRFSDLTIEVEGDGVRVTYDPGDSFLLEDVALSRIGASDFDFL